MRSAISVVFRLIFETNQYSCFMQKVFIIKKSAKSFYYDQISCCVTEEKIRWKGAKKGWVFFNCMDVSRPINWSTPKFSYETTIRLERDLAWLQIIFYVRQSTLSRTASYKITLVRLSVCPSVCPSVRPSLSFLKIKSLVFSDIVHDDSWSWYLVTDRARFLKKKRKLVARIWAKWPKIGPKTRFVSIFSSFAGYFSLKLHIMIACNNA